MTWTALPELIRGIVESITGLAVVWKNDAQPFVGDAQQAIVRLHWLSSTAKGGDDYGYAEVGSTGVVRETVKGNRFFVIQAMVDSYSQEPSAAARGYVEKLRTAMGWSSVGETLTAYRCAFIDAAALVDHDTEIDDRVISRSSLDLRFSYTDALEDSAHPIGWIEHAEIVNPTLGIDDTIPPME